MPESMAMYEHNGPFPFRLASKPEAEARLWALEGFAGGIQPWWHHIGAYHEDRRQYKTAESLFRWHEANEAYLIHREPVAPVGIVWSQENVLFYGRDEANFRVEQPWQGFTRALSRARISYQPIHADQIDQAADKGITVLVFPNVGGLSDAQVRSVKRFIEAGGSIIFSGESGRFDEWGEARISSSLADLAGIRFMGTLTQSPGEKASNWDDWNQHTYLRLFPELRAGVYGPVTGSEPISQGSRHPVLSGFEETDLLPFGGLYTPIERTSGDAEAPVMVVPPCPVYPPETAWMRTATSSQPAVVLRELPSGGRVVYFAADIDRCYARNPLPDYANLLTNAVRWAVKDHLPLDVHGAGLLDCRLYRQDTRLILHLVNLTGTDPRPAVEFIPVGPIRVRVRPPQPANPAVPARLLVAETSIQVENEQGWWCFEVPVINDHEVVVLGE